MTLPRIKLAVLGRLPPEFDPADLIDWSSTTFEIDPRIDSYELNEDAQGPDWEFTDRQLEKYLSNNLDGDFMVILLSVKLQDNWYVRRLSKNRILFTFYDIDQILRFHRIPLKNVALRVLYAASLIYRRYGNRIPPATEPTSYAHDETRGCLFDINSSKIDIVRSCHEPILCEYCISQLKSAQVSNEVLRAVQSEIKKIRKPLFERMSEFVQTHPIWSIVVSVLTALIIGVLASIAAAFIYDGIKAASS
jgi:hypothetical protein